MVTASKLPIDTRASAQQMAQTIFGDGVQVTGASYTGDRNSSGIYSNGDTVSPGVTPADSGLILSTGRATNFTNSGQGAANQATNTTTNTRGPNNLADFNAASGANTYDAAFLDVDFVPTGNTMSMDFVFSSEEYPEFSTSQFQDFVGVWVNGDYVPINLGNGSVSPNSVNSGANSNLFVDNTASAFNTEMDGFTLTLSLTIPVNSGQVNSIRIGIADVGDSYYDSNLLIAAGSVQTTLVAGDDFATLFPTGSKTIDLLANDLNQTGGTLTVTQINGQNVQAGDTVTLASGQTVTLNADGTVTVTGDGDIEQVNFTYETTSSTGISDTGMVTIDSVPCFVAGTRIHTPQGMVPVEALRPGDLVTTRDEGPQPLRWIGTRQVEARGDFAPILIDADTFGPHGTLMLSPLHRVLIRDSLAELLFGEREVLVAARDLVNDCSVRRVEGGMVEYVHILFDHHQVVVSEGLETESFLPGPQIACSFEAEMVEEICRLFPELDPDTGAGYGNAARRTLRRYEAQILFRARQVA